MFGTVRRLNVIRYSC